MARKGDQKKIIRMRERKRMMRDERERARAIEQASEVREMCEWLRRCTPRDFLLQGMQYYPTPNNPS